MFKNNKQDAKNLIKQIFDEVSRLNDDIFKLDVFIRTKQLEKNLSEEEKQYIDECGHQLSGMKQYKQALENRTILLEHSLESMK